MFDAMPAPALIDIVDYCSANSCSHYDMARLAAAAGLGAFHRYSDKGWEAFEQDGWVRDPRGLKLGKNIACTLSTACNERALYYQARVDEHPMNELRVMALIKLVLKMREATYMRHVVSECKAFFEHFL